MKKLLLILSTVTYFNVHAQLGGGGIVVVPPTLNDSVINSFKVNDNEFYFQGLWNLNSATFLEDYRHLLNISPVCGLEMIDFQKDDSTYHYWFKFQQTHNGFNVEDRDVLFIEKGGELLSISGSLTNNFKSDGGIPTISESTARSIAIGYAQTELGIDTFAWEIPDIEDAYKELYEDSTFTFYPSDLQRVYTAEEDSLTTNPLFILAWVVPIHGERDGDNYTIYIDAETGDILKHTYTVYECGQIGTANIEYNGQRNINTHHRAGLYNDYSLQHCTMGGTHLKTCYTFKRANYNIPQVLLNDDTAWGDHHKKFTSAHWWASMSKEYFNIIHNKKFWNKSDEVIPIRQLQQWSDDHLSAMFHFYKDKEKYPMITIPLKENGLDVTYGTLDIVGHEYTHGNIFFSSKLRGSKEAKSLNEGFADIFGNLIEHYSLGSVDWSLREWSPIRDMQDPHSTSNPKTYLTDPYWQNYDYNIPLEGRIKDPAIHNNATVASHWFYLLQSQIGIAKASKIAFRTGINYLNNTSNFAHARTKSIEAAQHLFGECSIETMRTVEAWNEVNVNPQSYAGCISISGPGPSFCYTQLDVPVNYTFYAQTNAGAVSSWSFSASGANYTTSGNSINVTRFTSNPASITATAHLVGGGTRTTTELIYFRECHVGPLYIYTFDGIYTIHPKNKYDTEPEMGEMPRFNDDSQGEIGGLQRLPKVSDQQQERSGTGRIQVYPSPTDHTLTILTDSKGNVNLDVQILDVLGRVVKAITLQNGSHVDVSELPAGVYSIKANSVDDNGMTTRYNTRFVKK